MTPGSTRRISILDVDPDLMRDLDPAEVPAARLRAVAAAAVLQLLMWYLADGWGTVEPEGVAIPLKLTRNILGRLVRAQRPTVTARLNDLADRGLLTRRADGGWMLHGEPGHQLRGLTDD